jgi:hypothetical protein
MAAALPALTEMRNTARTPPARLRPSRAKCAACHSVVVESCKQRGDSRPRQQHEVLCFWAEGRPGCALYAIRRRVRAPRPRARAPCVRRGGACGARGEAAAGSYTRPSVTCRAAAPSEAVGRSRPHDGVRTEPLTGTARAHEARARGWPVRAYAAGVPCVPVPQVASRQRAALIAALFISPRRPDAEPARGCSAVRPS